MPGEQSELRHVSCYSYYVAAPQGLTLWSLLLTRHCFSAELNQVVMAMSDWATKDDSPPPHWGWSQRAVGTSRWALSCPRPIHLCPGSSCGLCANPPCPVCLLHPESTRLHPLPGGPAGAQRESSAALTERAIQGAGEDRGRGMVLKGDGCCGGQQAGFLQRRKGSGEGRLCVHGGLCLEHSDSRV